MQLKQKRISADVINAVNDQIFANDIVGISQFVMWNFWWFSFFLKFVLKYRNLSVSCWSSAYNNKPMCQSFLTNAKKLDILFLFVFPLKIGRFLFRVTNRSYWISWLLTTLTLLPIPIFLTLACIARVRPHGRTAPHIPFCSLEHNSMNSEFLNFK